jgi:hypothetical protein
VIAPGQDQADGLALSMGEMAPKLSVAMRWSNGAEGLLPRLT